MPPSARVLRAAPAAAREQAAPAATAVTRTAVTIRRQGHPRTPRTRGPRLRQGLADPAQLAVTAVPSTVQRPAVASTTTATCAVTVSVGNGITSVAIART